MDPTFHEYEAVSENLREMTASEAQLDDTRPPYEFCPSIHNRIELSVHTPR